MRSAGAGADITRAAIAVVANLRAAIAPIVDITRADIMSATEIISRHRAYARGHYSYRPYAYRHYSRHYYRNHRGHWYYGHRRHNYYYYRHEIRRSVSHWNGRWWGGRWYAYGVGPCWSLQPGGLFIWVCVP